MCTLASALEDAALSDLDAAGVGYQHQCALADAAEAGLSLACNKYQCACSDLDGDGECETPTCEAIGSNPGGECDNQNECVVGRCGGGKVAQCVDMEPVACELFGGAACVVAPACDPDAGCPSADAIDWAASSASCATQNQCATSSTCDPSDPGADPVTGCVTTYKPSGALCSLDAPCVQEAECQAVEGGGIECVVVVECDDGDACTIDSCEDAACVATPMDCADDNPCTTESCDEGACSAAADPTVCDDDNPCTVDSCDPDAAQTCSHDSISGCDAVCELWGDAGEAVTCQLRLVRRKSSMPVTPGLSTSVTSSASSWRRWPTSRAPRRPAARRSTRSGST